MKKGLALALALLLTLMALPALAEPVGETQPVTVTASNYEELTVGTATAMSGCFFGDMWGENTADMDVRTLLHGYHLVRWNGNEGSFGIDPSVVSGLVVTDDAAGNRTYTVALYNDLLYSDGTPITARDYAFSILLSIAPQTAQIGGSISSGSYILGIDEYLSGQSATLAGLRVLDERQLALTIKAEYLPFFYELAPLNYCPYPISVIAPGCEVVDDGEGAYIRGPFTADTLRTTVLDEKDGYLSHPSVTSGPYMLTSYDAKENVARFEINPFYKGNSDGKLPQIQRLVYKWVPAEEMMTQLANGEIGLINKCVNANLISQGLQLLSTGKAAVSNYARSGFSFISFSCERPTVGSAAVRKAIAHCFDKDAFIQSYVSNYGYRVDGYYGIGQWMYRLVSGAVASPLAPLEEEATAEEEKAYEEKLAAWESLSMEDMPVYDLDVQEAVRLLEQDGWTLNKDGEAFAPAKDDVRCKEVDGTLTALELSLLYPEGNAIGEALDAVFVDNLKQAGIVLHVESKPFQELLEVYYRHQERTYDMIYLATNFANVFDPSRTFAPDDAHQGVDNRTGIEDQELYDLAVSMRLTQPGDTLAYCQKWVSFQKRWVEVLPAIPVYSNVYFDFYTPTLQGYNAGSNVSWAEAIVEAYLGDGEAEVPVQPAGDEIEEFVD